MAFTARYAVSQREIDDARRLQVELQRRENLMQERSIELAQQATEQLAISSLALDEHAEIIASAVMATAAAEDLSGRRRRQNTPELIREARRPIPPPRGGWFQGQGNRVNPDEPTFDPDPRGTSKVTG